MPSARFLSPSETAGRLGVSTKALRLYEQHGLVHPARTAAGWRAYGPDQMARAAEIAALRALGLSLAQVALAAHQATLEGRVRQLIGTVEKVRAARADLTGGRAPAAGLSVAFELPWPWGGERFELSDIRPLNYIIGPLGSGKTRLALRLAETSAERRLPGNGEVGGRWRGGAGAAGRRPGAQIAG